MRKKQKNRKNKCLFFSSIKSFFIKGKTKSRPKKKRRNEEEFEDDKIKEVIVERNDGFNLVEVILIVFITVLFGMAAGYALSFTKPTGEEVSKEVQEIISTYENIVENYYGEVSKEELLDAAISGMITTLDDPYSLFMSQENANTFNETVDGSFVGIGVTVEHLDGKFKIIEVFDDSPAKKAKIKVEDYIIKVNDESVEGMDLKALSVRIKDKNNSKVKMTIKREEEELEFTLKRGVIEVPSVESRIINENIGVIKIDTFALNTSEQFKKQLKSLEKKKIESLIIDVRGNPGGRLGEVSEIMDLFLGKNKVVYQISTKSKTEKIYTEDATKRSYPVVILVDYNSASASEILAASFQDNYKKANLVGTVTYGKGTIQKAVNLSSGSTIKYTTQKWLTPRGEWINEVGLTPDILLENDEEYINNPCDAADLQLQKAIEILNEKRAN